MIPILFDEAETKFDTNGLGRLTDASSCVVTEERNGQYELELKYPVMGKLFYHIRHSRIIFAKPSQGEQPQAFRIYKISRPFSGTITVNAQHISYQLSNVPVRPFQANTLAGALKGLKENSMEQNPFTFDTDIDSTIGYGIKTPISCRSLLGGHDGSILDVYGNGEWRFDNWNCHFLKARGKDNGVTIRYGKNLTDLTQEENISEVLTGIVAYWKDPEDTADCIFTDPVEAPTVELYPFKRTEVVDFSENFEEKPTKEELVEAAQQYILSNNIGYPEVSLQVSFVNLADTDEYRDIAPLETVNLCDTVTVIFERLGVNQKAKIITTEYDVLNEQYNKIEVGSKRSDLSTMVADQGRQVETVEGNVASFASEARKYAQSIVDWLTNGLGYVIPIRGSDSRWDGLLFLDHPTERAATRCLKIDGNGISFASGEAGTFGNWTFRQAWEMSGAMSLGGSGNHTFKVLTANGNDVVCQIDNKQMTVNCFDSNGRRLYNVQFGDGVRVTGNNNTTSIKSGEASFAKGNANVSINDGCVKLTDGNNTAEVKPDGMYVNGSKLGTSGYTGRISRVPSYYDGNYYIPYDIVVENGVIKRVENPQ